MLFFFCFIIQKVAALQAKVNQVEKERQEEERARHAAEEKARAEQKARAEKEAKKLRKMRKSEESLDKTMTDLFKPDGVIVHESPALAKKDSESDIQVDPISQTLSEKSSGGHAPNSSETVTSKSVTINEASTKTTPPSTPSTKIAVSVTSPKPVLSKTDDHSGTPTPGLAKTVSTHKTTSTVPFPKTVPSKTQTVTPVSITTTSGESPVATSTTAITTAQKVTVTSANDKPVPVSTVANSDTSSSSSTQSSSIVTREKTVSPPSVTKTPPSLVDGSHVAKKIPPFSLKERNSVEKKAEKTVQGDSEPVRVEAQTTMSNEKLASDNATKVSVSIGCQADEDSGRAIFHYMCIYS